MDGVDHLLERVLRGVDKEMTRRSYEARLRKAVEYTGAKSVKHLVLNPDAHYRALQVHYPSVSSRKSVLTAVLAVFKFAPDLKERHEAAYQGWTTRHRSLTVLVESDAKQSMPNERQLAKYVSFDDVRAKLKELSRADDAHATLHDSMRLCLLGMLVHLKPKRADFGSLRVYRNKDPGKSDENYIVLHRKETGAPSYLVLNKYKTADKFNRLEEEFPPQLHSIVRTSLRRYPRQYVFHDRDEQSYSNAAYGKYFTRTFKSLFGKEMGVSLWRHVYITERLDPRKQSLLEQEDTARLMGHSKSMQDRYRFKSFKVQGAGGQRTYECRAT